MKPRLERLRELGLGYLTLARESTSLSGGEAQRIRLATQVGSGLHGLLYVLDEPSIGLHARDQERLIATLVALRDAGRRLAVVDDSRIEVELTDEGAKYIRFECWGKGESFAWTQPFMVQTSE